MTELENDPWIQAIGAVLLVASIAPWIFLIQRWLRKGVLLPYEARRPVPWGIAGAFLAVAFTALTISAALSMGEPPANVPAPTARQIAYSLLASMVMQSCGPVLLVVIALMTNAKRGDIGLPTFSATAIGRDIAIGIIVCLAAMMPVRLAQLAMMFALNMPQELTKHPLVEMLMKSEPETFILALATIMAVVVAPIGEEITFRLLLQGWLEKWEDYRLGWRRAGAVEGVIDDGAEIEMNAIEGDVQLAPVVESTEPTLPPARGLGGLPYGWAPILISSFLFAAAHFGYGPEPIPLFVLALFLGYCYQRTHRILPCIVAHSLFNLCSMIVLWRIVLNGAK